MKPAPNTKEMAVEHRKERPVKEAAIHYQGKAMYPCAMLSFWCWWGDELFDIRDAAKVLGVPTPGPIPIPRTSVSFAKTLSPILVAANGRSFADVVEQADALTLAK